MQTLERMRVAIRCPPQRSSRVPPLRQRREDIPILLEHFLERARSQGRSRLEGFSMDAIDVLCRYGWPGNVRELENLVERLVVMRSEGLISLADLPTPFERETPPALAAPLVPSSGISFADEVNRFETDLIIGTSGRPLTSCA